MLTRPLALHHPGCDGGGCAPKECVQDVEPFCSAVLDDFSHGERVAQNPGSHAFLSMADKEDALAFLIAASFTGMGRLQLSSANTTPT